MHHLKSAKAVTNSVDEDEDDYITTGNLLVDFETATNESGLIHTLSENSGSSSHFTNFGQNSTGMTAAQSDLICSHKDRHGLMMFSSSIPGKHIGR